MIKVSIITVVFNNKETIAEAIESVISQSYKDIEYIIIDGGSTDGTLDVIRKYKSSIDVFLSEPDDGIYDAMNKGLRLAAGDIIGILNSDDLFASDDVIETIVTAFKDEKVDMVYGNLVYVKRDNIAKVVRRWKSRPYYKGFFEDGHVPPHTSLYIKRLVYERLGIFNDNLKLAADYEIMLRFFKDGLFQSKYIDKLIIKMRLGGSTNKSLKNIINGNKEIWRSWKINGLIPPLRLMPLRILKRLNQFL